MRWLLLLLLVPHAAAMRIAVTPPDITLDEAGQGEMTLLNPNNASITYVVDGLIHHAGELGAHERARISVDVADFYGDSTLVVKARPTKGSQGVGLQPALQVPVSRLRPAVIGGPSLLFSIAFVVTLVLAIRFI